MGQARAVQFVAPRRVAVVPVDLAAPAADQLLVRTLASGVSGGTELLAYRGLIDPAMPLDETLGALGGTFTFPFRYGYSCVGVIEDGASPGSPDTGALVFAFHPHQDRFTVAGRDVVPLPAGTDPVTGTLFPLVETALQLTLDAGSMVTEPVAVLGLGPVGLLTALLLQRGGAVVLGCDPRDDRRAAASGLGLDAVAPEDLPGAVRSRTGGRGLPLLVELSGDPQTLAGALDLLRHEGTALVGSWYGTETVPLPLGGAFHRRRLTIRASQVSTVPAAMSADWDVERRRAVARDLLAELPLQALTTTSYPFERAAEAYASLDRGELGVLHVALTYER